jgi:hypothetical protein
MSVTSGSFRWLVPPRASGTGGSSAAAESSRPSWPSLAPCWSSSHLLAGRSARYEDLSPDYYTTTIDTSRKARSHLPPAASTRIRRHPRPRRLIALAQAPG